MNYVFTDIFYDKGNLENKTCVKTGFKPAKEFLKICVPKRKDDDIYREAYDDEIKAILRNFKNLKQRETVCFEFEDECYDCDEYLTLIVTAV